VGKHLISPNIHVIMVHFPLGILVFGLSLEIFSFLWRRSSVTVAARWMILFGALMSVPAAFSGIDALKDVNDYSVEDISEQARMLLRSHLLWASLGAGLAVVAVVIGMALREERRNRLVVRLPLLLVLLAGAAMMGFGSHYGGEGVYLQSVAVKLRGKPAKGFEYYAPARSTHILLSGFAVAVGLGALGASLRVLGTHTNVRRQEEDAERDLEALESGSAALYSPPAPPRRVTDDVSVARTLNADVVIDQPRVPAGRFWLLTSLIALVAFGFGIWLLISVEDSSFFEEHRATATDIYQEVIRTATTTTHEKDEQGKEKGLLQNRRMFHILLGGAVVVLPLLLAGGVRWMAHHKLTVGVLCFLIVLVIAGQVWTGILLIHDAASGPLLRFTPQSQQTADAAK
jgi:uncharacterized membrane protein